MGKLGRQSSPSQGDASADDAPKVPPYKVPPVYIDDKGRLSVKPDELAASEAFRAQVAGMVELAKTHPPRSG